MPKWVMAPYTYACDTYCKKRWGPPSDEVIPKTCPKCEAMEKRSAEANAKNARVIAIKNYYKRFKDV
jgi:hypothetical protein